MRTENTSIRLKKIMNDRGLKQVDILKLAKPFCKKYNVKLEKNDLSQYISGKVEPSQKKLTVLANALNTNEVWLMGYDYKSEPFLNPKKNATLDKVRARVNEKEELEEFAEKELKDLQKEFPQLIKIPTDDDSDIKVALMPTDKKWEEYTEEEKQKYIQKAQDALYEYKKTIKEEDKK